MKEAKRIAQNMTLPVGVNSLVLQSYSDRSKLFAILDEPTVDEFTKRTGLKAGDFDIPIYISKDMVKGKGLIVNADGNYTLFDIK